MADRADQTAGMGIDDSTAKDLLAQLPFSMVITDPNREDHPIIYVNRAFEKVTGYSASMAVGRNCRFLQEDDRDQEARDKLRNAIKNEEAVTVDLRNYRAGGELFINRLMIAPIHDDHGDLFAFIGIQSELSPAESEAAISSKEAMQMLEETQHRVKNHLAMVASMIRLEAQSQEEDAPIRSFDVLARRIDSLSVLYDEFTQTSMPTGGRYDVVSAGAYISRVVSTVGALDGRSSIRLNVDTDTIPMRTNDAANLGLVVSEVLSNTFQHAFDGRAEGLVEVRLKALGSDRVRLTISDDGVGLGDSNWPEEGNLGARLVRAISRSLKGEMGMTSPGTGAIFTLDLPNSLPTEIEEDGGRAVTKSDQGEPDLLT